MLSSDLKNAMSMEDTNYIISIRFSMSASLSRVPWTERIIQWYAIVNIGKWIITNPYNEKPNRSSSSPRMETCAFQKIVPKTTAYRTPVSNLDVPKSYA